MESNLILIVSAALGLLFVFSGVLLFFKKKSSLEGLKPEEKSAEEVDALLSTHEEASESPTPALKLVDETAPVSVVSHTKEPKPLSERLSRTSGGFFSRLGKFLGRDSSSVFSAAEWDEMEEALLMGDVGIQTAGLLLGKVRERLKSDSSGSLRDLLISEGQSLLSGVAHGLPDLSCVPKPYVISIVGVNGVGKTTTIGKLAHAFTAKEKTVLLGAGDTFRAAAITQLKVWADRVGTQFVAGREGGDPGAVAFDSVTAAKARGIDVVLLDTAGRLHTKSNLMEELKKVHRVVKKVIPEAPHETWLVLDGTLGQNSVQQAKEFQKTLDLTGVIVTKLDGTAKGGALLSIAAELKLPIRFIGIGESVEDLIPFEPRPFVEAILGGTT